MNLNFSTQHFVELNDNSSEIYDFYKYADVDNWWEYETFYTFTGNGTLKDIC